MAEPRRIGNVHDVAERYGTDAAAVWEWICWRTILTAPDGARVWLSAPPEDRVASHEGGTATMWIVSEVPA